MFPVWTAARAGGHMYTTPYTRQSRTSITHSVPASIARRTTASTAAAHMGDRSVSGVTRSTAGIGKIRFCPPERSACGAGYGFAPWRTIFAAG